jgi:hypothetical protein
LRPAVTAIPQNLSPYRPHHAKPQESQTRRELERRRPPGQQVLRLPIRWLPVTKRAELEACDQWAAQGKRIRVWPVVTIPRPEFVIFSTALVSPHSQIQRVQWTSVALLQPSPENGYLACTTPQQALRAVVRCSQDPAGARPSKCIIIIITIIQLPITK